MAATAVEAWDERWATPEGRGDWLVPHPAVAALVPVLKARGAQHVLDLGCGVGRHALFFAEHGFAVEATDGAAAGLDFACREAAARGLRLSLRQTTPYSFDGLVSTLGSAPRRDPRFFLMKNLRVNVDVRFDVAAILQWVVIAAAMFLT